MRKLGAFLIKAPVEKCVCPLFLFVCPLFLFAPQMSWLRRSYDYA